MYLPKGDLGGMIIENEDNGVQDTHKKDPEAISAHDKWKNSVNARKCREFSGMSYWQNVSTCTQL